MELRVEGFRCVFQEFLLPPQTVAFFPVVLPLFLENIPKEVKRDENRQTCQDPNERITQRVAD